MTRITSGLLSDTLNLVQLARETMLQQGKQAEASRLSPVVDNLLTAVNTSRQKQPPARPSGILAQDDFGALLAASQMNAPRPAAPVIMNNSTPASPSPSTGPAPVSSANPVPNTSPLERNRIIVAMAGGNMSDIDIARQMGMTREEVRMVLNISQRTQSLSER